MSTTLAGERGAITVLLLIALPVLVLFASFAIDSANFWVHKRHLQTMADAAALAGAQAIGPVGCDETAIGNEVAKYAGGTYNQQVGDTPASRIHARTNEQTFYNQASPIDAEVTGTPCETMTVDVKMTETDAPWLLRAIDAVDFMNAHARVSLLQVDTASGMLPVGVPEVNPRKVAVQFVNEVTGENIGGVRELRKRSGASGGNIIWDNAIDNGGVPFPVTVDASRIGVRAIVSGTSSLTCGEQQVECYDTDSAQGLLMVRGWSAAPAVAIGSTSIDAPQARSVFLLPGTCPGAYFVLLTADCKASVGAKLEFSLSGADLAAGKARVWATSATKEYPLAYNATNGLFEAASAIPVAVGAGPVEVGLKWEQRAGKVGSNSCTTGGNNPCKGTIAGPVQRVFSGTPSRSGPIQAISISDQAGTTANSVQRCSTDPVYADCTRLFTVSVAVQGTFEVSEATDPPTVLRIGSESGSLNQALDCDPAVGFVEEIAYGCGPDYTVNTGTACPDSTQALWDLPQPWNCVAVQPGDATNKIPNGLNQRILGSEKPAACTAPNSWPDFSKDDPRIVPVFLVPFGAFAGANPKPVAVSRFAYFYVTGWVGGGGGFENPCYGAGDDPVPGNDRAAMAGHFIKYISNANTAGAGGEKCDLASLDGCVSVMTR